MPGWSGQQRWRLPRSFWGVVVSWVNGFPYRRSLVESIFVSSRRSGGIQMRPFPVVLKDNPHCCALAKTGYSSISKAVDSRYCLEEISCQADGTELTCRSRELIRHWPGVAHHLASTERHPETDGFDAAIAMISPSVRSSEMSYPSFRRHSIASKRVSVCSEAEG